MNSNPKITTRRGVMVVGTPAVYARRLFRRFASLGLLILAGGGGAAWVAYQDANFMAAAMIAAATCGAVAVTFQRAGQARVGVVSERKVVAELTRTGVRAVICGARPGGVGGDVDIVALGPGAAAIEVKTGYGKVTYSRGALWVGNRRVMGDPIGQAARGAGRIGRALGGQVWVDALVCVPGMSNKPFSVRNGQTVVWVCGLGDLGYVLSRLPFRVTDNQVKPLVGALIEAGRQLGEAA